MRRIAALAISVLALTLVACSDEQRLPNAPEEGAQLVGTEMSILVTCQANLSEGVVHCGPTPQQQSGVVPKDVTVGSPFVRMIFSSVRKRGDIASADVSVQNLLDQAMGTPDGSTVTGITVFFHTGPTNGVEVANPDGRQTFTAPNQPFFHYNEILEPLEISAPRRWQFRLNGASTSTFQVYIRAKLPNEGNIAQSQLTFLDVTPRQQWVTLAPGRLTITVGVRDPDGVEAISAFLIDPAGSRLVSGCPVTVPGAPDPAGSWELISGTPTDGVWRCTNPVAMWHTYVEAPLQLQVRDRAGNATYFTSSFSVVLNDSEPPMLTDFKAEVGESIANVFVEAGDPAGVGQITAFLINRARGSSVVACGGGEFRRILGTPTGGTWQCTSEVVPPTDVGVKLDWYIQLVDLAGNTSPWIVNPGP